MVILQDPSLLLVDEPVAGMSDKETEQTGRLLQSLAEKHAIIVIEHDMEFVRQIARIVTVLQEGTVICEGPWRRCRRMTMCEKSIWAAKKSRISRMLKRPPASFSARQDPQRTPEGTPPVFSRRRPCWKPF